MESEEEQSNLNLRHLVAGYRCYTNRLMHVAFTFRLGIKTIINLETFGEHAHCGPPLTTSGFTYFPEDFMRHNSKLDLRNPASRNTTYSPQIV